MELVKIKTIHKWFQCDLCPREGDTYYLLIYKGKEIKVCEICLENIDKEKSDEMYLSKMD